MPFVNPLSRTDYFKGYCVLHCLSNCIRGYHDSLLRSIKNAPNISSQKCQATARLNFYTDFVLSKKPWVVIFKRFEQREAFVRKRGAASF